MSSCNVHPPDQATRNDVSTQPRANQQPCQWNECPVAKLAFDSRTCRTGPPLYKPAYDERCHVCAACRCTRSPTGKRGPIKEPKLLDRISFSLSFLSIEYTVSPVCPVSQGASLDNFWQATRGEGESRTLARAPLRISAGAEQLSSAGGDEMRFRRVVLGPGLVFFTRAKCIRVGPSRASLTSDRDAWDRYAIPFFVRLLFICLCLCLCL